MGIQRFHSSSLVFLAMTTTIILSITGEAFAAESPLAKVASMSEWCNNQTRTYLDLCMNMTNTLQNGTCDQAMRLALGGTIEKFKEAITKIDSIRKSPNNPQDNMSSLGLCRGSYDIIIGHLNDALTEKDYRELRNYFSEATALVENCNDTFDQMKVSNPISDINSVLDNMTGVLLDFAANYNCNEDAPLFKSLFNQN